MGHGSHQPRRWNRVFRNVGTSNSDAVESPKRNNIQHSQNGESYKSGKLFLFNYMTVTWNADLTYVPETIE